MLMRKPAMIERQGRRLWYHGNATLIDQPLDTLLCSNACPGAKIIEAMDCSSSAGAPRTEPSSAAFTPRSRRNACASSCAAHSRLSSVLPVDSIRFNFPLIGRRSSSVASC